ncbi:Rha family transcriptional regulator [Streptococcus oralis]|uniref:Rha family transcriptional regulator n=1 Tax=Streptococcus oralis TaxID=1303 RepID=UPI0022838AAF|nr:Rha family transcriptional regulator [Streptococcus oralis]MCY7111310.1 Rha family transcriptional regulator [Streptococcus oralis]
MELVYMDGKKEPYTTSEIIAECAEVKHDTVQSLIRNHQEDFESYGIIGFEIRKLDGRGRPMKIYRLNEQQATLLITYLKNTEPVRQFKMNLVKAFFEMRDELSKRQLQRELEKPKRKSLTEAIQTWEKAPKHAYSTLTNLLLKGVTGKNKTQLMKERESKNGIDGLSSVELTSYQRLEDMVIAMINLNRGYSEIKELIFKV